MPKTADVKETAIHDLTEPGWFHFGLLPHEGPVKMTVPNKSTGREEVREFDPWLLYNGLAGLSLTEDGDCSIFVSKVRHWNSLGVRGWTFPSVSEAVRLVAGDLSRMPFPGNAARFPLDTADGAHITAEGIVCSAWRHFVRFPRGIERMDEPQQAFIWDMEFGQKPTAMTDEEWRAYKRAIQIEGRGMDAPCPVFNPRTDKYVAEFVYLVRLPSVDLYPADLDEVEYARNPNLYHQRILPHISRAFFSAPPKSIAEMYPQET